jgi:hypothetical protein
VLENLTKRARVILRRRQAYRAIFLDDRGPTPMSEIVLADLRRACCADRPTTVTDLAGRTDAIASARNEGRREVWLRIQQALYLDDEKIYRMLDAAEVEQ